MTDEEVIALDLGEVLGKQFLFWDEVVMHGHPDLEPQPIRRIAQQIIDEGINEALRFNPQGQPIQR